MTAMTFGRARVGAAALLLALAACGGDGGGGEAGGGAAKGGGTDPAAAAGTAREDSAAVAGARLGDRVPRPDSLRALYVNGWAAGGRTRMRELIRIADETEINAFVVDIKESDTYLTHDSTGIALAREIGADTMPRSRWLPALVDSLRAHGIYPIARIVVFKDRMLAERKPELAIRHTDGSVWLDQKGKPWVNPYDRRVWDYNIAIAREALDMGFSEIQWDYVRFPDVTDARRRTMAFPGSNGKARDVNIEEFIRYSREQLAEYRVPVTADVFGLVTHLAGDVGIGQNWERVITASDAVLPMVYPSHYFGGVYGFTKPNAHPYEMVRISMADAVERTRAVQAQGKKTGEIIPWLQAFTADYLRDGITYGPSHVRQQIAATYDSGLKSWVLWNPGSKYDVYLPALRPADGSPSALERGGWKPLRWEPPRGRMSPVVRQMDRQAAQAAAGTVRGTPADSARRGGAPGTGAAGRQ
ncbi:MAG TPA: putative glycoside hydrolase [Longimicrobium sp.]|nr:putative glycoside hydrolase [Longimicrobium sp.]